jgi:hypothetical protein
MATPLHHDGQVRINIDDIETAADAILVDTGTTLPASIALCALKTDGFQTVSKTITLGLGSVPVTEALFTVTGEVEARVFGYVDTAPTSGGAMTLELGDPRTRCGGQHGWADRHYGHRRTRP